MRVLFAGTPEAALPTLQRLCDSGHEVVGVITREDAPTGRGRSLSTSPVAEYAFSRGLHVIKSNRINERAHELAQLDPDVAVIVAYGGLIKDPLLTQWPWINVHFSLLPAYRGAAPVQHALLNGDEITGVSTFILDQGLDTGAVLGQATETIRPEDSAGTLLDRLAHSGAELLLASLAHWDEITPLPQTNDGASQAPKITTEMAQIEWKKTAPLVERHIRAMTPKPGAWTRVNEGRLVINRARVLDEELCAGQMRFESKRVIVGTATKALELIDVTPQGKRTMTAAEWGRGLRIETATCE